MSNGDELDKAEASFEFEVTDPTAEYGCTISVELDNELNGDRNCFAPGEEFWIRIYSPVSYAIYTSGGDVRNIVRDITKQIPDPDDPEEDEFEYINFAEWQGSSSKPIWFIIEKFWCHTNLGEVRWRRKYSEMSVLYDVSTSLLGYSVLRMKYRTIFDRALIRAPIEPHDIKILVYSTDDDEPDCKAELQVAVRENCEKQRPKEVTIEVENCESEQIIPGVSVYINDEYKGDTDDGGQLYIGLMSPGEYEIRFEHADYWPSGADAVVNDTLVVD